MNGILSVLWYIYALVHMPGRSLSKPSQVRTAWTETQKEILVQWVTQSPVYGARVEYKLAACQGRDVLESPWQRSDADWRFIRKANKLEWQYLNLAAMAPLDPECRYTYRVGSAVAMTGDFSIAGLTPALGVGNRRVRLAVIGDMGIGANASWTRNHVSELAAGGFIDAVLHVGDIAYSLNDKWKQTADQYFTEVQSFAAYVPYMVLPGNHERYENFTQYKSRFRMPRNEASGASNFFYSFDLANAHIIMYNTEAYFVDFNEALIATQLHWLQRDLELADKRRADVPWVVVMGHKPYYCAIDWNRPFFRKDWESNHDCKVRAEVLRNEVEELFYSHNVDLYIAGHVHRYEREAPIYHNQTLTREVDTKHYHYNPQAPVFILEGSAGSRKGLDDLAMTPQPWVQAAVHEYGFGTLEITNQTHIQWRQYDSITREIVDHLVIEKQWER